MLTYLRYALATFCLAASVGCLVILGWSARRSQSVECVMSDVGPLLIDVQLCRGEAKVAVSRNNPIRRRVAPSIKTLDGIYLIQFDRTYQSQGYFATAARSVYFPLWYPALIFALAGVAALRFRRQFSIRSALIAVSVVAALLGMVVAL